VVRSVVAVCLMGRVLFAPIDSLTMLRKLENDQNAMLAERIALGRRRLPGVGLGLLRGV
jgi:mRNA (2'-O-methyladenosine-N6-)-methyltransferase